jgi:two-component system, OmpR family, alkaline phosphatase synthesis response regulator PhoP
VHAIAAATTPEVTETSRPASQFRTPREITRSRLKSRFSDWREILLLYRRNCSLIPGSAPNLHLVPNEEQMLKFLFSRIPEDIAQPSILLIDDDRDIRTVTNLVLLAQCIGNVIKAGTGREGIEAARTHRPDAILLDMNLPDLSGETVLQLLRADPWTRDIPVILFIAFAGDLGRLQTLGVIDIVAKPFHPQRLCDVIHRVFGSRSTGNNIPVNAAVTKARISAVTTGQLLSSTIPAGEIRRDDVSSRQSRCGGQSAKFSGIR